MLNIIKPAGSLYTRNDFVKNEGFLKDVVYCNFFNGGPYVILLSYIGRRPITAHVLILLSIWIIYSGHYRYENLSTNFLRV